MPDRFGISLHTLALNEFMKHSSMAILLVRLARAHERHIALSGQLLD
jgi:hypothetical protein